jgi:hypothetical protein
VVRSLEEARELVDEIGYPVIAKPDIGVGAAKTYKIHKPSELESFFAQKPAVDYILEEFVDGVICSFDGLLDREGKLVFYTGHEISRGVMETVNDDANIYYYSFRQIPPDLEEAGRKALNGFQVRKRFFHLEFFRRRSDSCIVALEVNMRPPGGLTTDMYNYANDIDIYYQWAHVVVHNHFTADYFRPYHCAYIGRKLNRAYLHPHEEILQRFRSCIVHHEPISGVFSTALGDYGYLVRSPSSKISITYGLYPCDGLAGERQSQRHLNMIRSLLKGLDTPDAGFDSSKSAATQPASGYSTNVPELRNSPICRRHP